MRAGERIILLSCIALATTVSGELLAKITFTVRRVWACTLNTTNEITFKNLKVYKIGRATFLDVDAISTVVFDDNVHATSKCSVWVNGGFKPRLTMPLGGVCSGLKMTMPLMFKSLTEHTHKSDCPLPPANYSLKKWPGYTDLSLPVPPGIYKASMIFTKNDNLIGCFHMESVATAVSKKKN